MKFLKKLVSFILNKNNNVFDNTINHLHLVKPGDLIRVEWHRVFGEIANLKCINNSPSTKKILLSVKWSNYEELGINETELVIFDYDGIELKNYHLLNPKPIKNLQQSNLYQQLQNALNAEDYLTAAKIRDQLKNS